MKQSSTLLLTFLLLLSSSFLLAQRTITGKVTDAESGQPMIAASVLVKGTSTGTVTDADGSFSLNVPDNANTLVISFIGYTPQEVAITGKVINVALLEGVELNNVVVIGSRNATRTKLDTPVPVDIIPLSQITNEVGQVDLNQILTYVAPSFQSARQTIADGTDHVDPAQLRGLGPDQVLVLVNGKRRHQSSLVNVNGTVNRGTVGTDLSAIPASAIERVEILRDGAAAQYGSDAIAGVINLVLKQKTGVLDGSVSYGFYNSEYEKNYALYKLTNNSADPSVRVTDGETVQAGLNYGFNLGGKGFINLTGEYISREPTNRTGTYTGQVYPSVGGQVRDDSILQAKGFDRNDFDMLIGQSKMTGGGAILNAEYNLSTNWSVYAFGGFNRKDGKAAGFFRYPSSIASGARTYANNIFAIYPNGFLPKINSELTDISAAVGLRGKLGLWNVDLSNTFGQNQFDFIINNSVNYTQAAVSPNNLQTEFDAGGTKFSQNTVNLDFSRNFPVLEGLNVAFGGEYRTESFGIRAGEESSWKNYDTASGAGGAAQVFPGFLTTNEGTNNRNSAAAYIDLEEDFTSNWMVGAAVRFENYSDFGSTVNYKAVTRYKIGNALTLRGSVSTGFRAPSMQQRFYAKTNTLFVTVNGQLQPVESGTFTNDSRPAQILGIPELKEETSQSYTVGLTTRPFDGLEISVDAYQIDIDNRIILTNNFSDGGDTLLRAQLQAANAGQANFFANAVDTRARGIEAVIAYATKFGGNQELKATLAGVFINNEVKKDDKGAPIIKASDILIRTGQVSSYFNREDQSRIEVANPKNKISLTLNYKVGHFSTMVRAVHFGEVIYLDPTINPEVPANFPTNAFTGQKETLDQTFSPKVVTDLTLSYEFVKGLTFTVGANNLFDVYQDRHTHSSNFSSGRFVYSRRVQQMGFGGSYYFGRLHFTF